MLSVLALLFPLLSSHLCPPPSLAQRTGSEHCWVRIPLGNSKQLCVSHSLWIKWLQSSNPGPICQSSEVPWRGYSYLENGKFLSSEFKKPPQKIPRYTQTLRTLTPVYSRNHISILLQKIEGLRERTSELLTPSDRLGITRNLILHEGVNPNLTGMLRRLGFVHLISASGIHLYALVMSWSWIMSLLCSSFRIPVRQGLWISRITAFGICLVIWLLTGARAGMLRPWLILLFREAARALGFQWRKASPLFLALALDLAVACFRSESRSGRWVYALAVGGGLFGCQSFPLSTHLGLAVGSWVWVALWEIWHTQLISVATPLLNLSRYRSPVSWLTRFS